MTVIPWSSTANRCARRATKGSARSCFEGVPHKGSRWRHIAKGEAVAPNRHSLIIASCQNTIPTSAPRQPHTANKPRRIQRKSTQPANQLCNGRQRNATVPNSRQVAPNRNQRSQCTKKNPTQINATGKPTRATDANQQCQTAAGKNPTETNAAKEPRRTQRKSPA